uniref:Glycosyltransferase n=1 Tax=viral metagenome TaxID=1070528 RepID=A0A6C0HRK8_9ZZZZ
MTTIILTTTVHVNRKIKFLYQTNPKERLQLYLESIRKWLNTSFNIIVVDNSGYPFNELENEKRDHKDRFEVITFKEKELNLCKYLHNNQSKGASEMFSINYAFNRSRLKEKTNFIIKVTGRFFIDGLEEFLKNYDLNNYSALTQRDKNRCEMVGCHRDHFWYIFSIFLITDKFKFEPHVETIWRDRISKYSKVITCKPFPIKETPRGSLNEKFKII